MLTRTLLRPSVIELPRSKALDVVVVLLLMLPIARLLFGDILRVSDDGLNHMLRLMALDSALHAGVLYPRWFPDFSFGYGYAVLNFYSPATYYLAELFHLGGAGFALSTKLMTFGALALSGVFMYLWTANVFGRVPAILAALAYVYFPYHLADAFVRGAFPEVTAFVFLPAILWCFQKAFAASRPFPWFAGAGLALSLLTLTHNFSVVMFAPLLAVYLLLLAYGTRRGRRLLLAALSGLSALGLSAFYWLPATLEARYVQIGQEVGVATGFVKHLYPLADYFSPFVVYRYFPDQGTAAEHPFGMIQVLALILSAISLPLIYRRSRQVFVQALFFLILTGVTVFLLLPISVDIWRITRVLPSLQYPYRLEALLALSTSFLVAAIPYALDRLPALRRAPRLSAALGAAPLGAAIILSGALNLPLADASAAESGISVQGMWSRDARLGQIGATWTNEFTPIYVQEERWRIPRSIAGVSAQPADQTFPPKVALSKSDGWSWSFGVDSPRALSLSAHAFYLPGWRALVDGQPVEAYPVGSLGLVGFDVPPGKHEVRLEFGTTPVRQLGTALSAASAIALAFLFVLTIPRRASFMLLAGFTALGIVATLHFLPQPSGPLSPVDANLQNAARLLGFQTDRSSYSPGDSVQLKLHWLGWETQGRDYKTFVHLVARPDTPPLAQHDGDPVGGFTPTSRWARGELLVDEHELELPASLAPGTYRLEVGMYDPVSLRNLSIVDDAGKPLGERVFLKEITLAAR